MDDTPDLMVMMVVRYEDTVLTVMVMTVMVTGTSDNEMTVVERVV